MSLTTPRLKNWIQKSLIALCMSLLVVSSASATSTILPQFDESDLGWPCDPADETYWPFWDLLFNEQDYFREVMSTISSEQTDSILACAIKTGNVNFWMLPFFVRNVLQFLISLSGLISVLMIIVGAYFYIAGGLTDDKEKGKTVIKYAIGGLVLSTLAWFIVNVILLAVTS